MIRHYCDGCNKELANEEVIKVRVSCTKLLHTTDWETLEMCADCARRTIPEHIIYDAEQKNNERKKKAAARKAEREKLIYKPEEVENNA